jgi:hypothetical protein
MADFSDRYVNKIPWVAFRNASGQTIPPFSLVTASSWYTPDSSDPVGGTSPTPFFTATQPGSDSYYSSNPSVNPHTLYITGREPTPPAPGQGPNGMAARPDIYPQLVWLDGAGGAGQLAGPLAGSWSLAAGSAGFVIVGSPVGGGYVPVKTLPGPYLGQANETIATGSSGPVDLWTGPKGAESDGEITFTCYNRFGLLNEGDSCLFDWIDQGWEIVELTSAAIVRGVLNDRLGKGGSTTLTVIDAYGNPTNTTVTVFEVLHINGYSYPAGTILQAVWNTSTGQWEVMQPLPQVMRGTLIVPLASGGQATVTATDGKPYLVYEVLGLNGGSLAAGTTVVAFFNNDTQQLEVMAAGCPATSGSTGGGGTGGGR